jgi:hypothetical protein
VQSFSSFIAKNFYCLACFSFKELPFLWEILYLTNCANYLKGA